MAYYSILNGIPAELWAKYSDIIKEFIEKNKPQQAGAAFVTPWEAQMGMTSMGMMEGKDGTESRMRMINIRGGMKIPHIHFEGNIYLLTDEQWKDFANRVMKKIQAKLATAGTVNFLQLINVSEAVHPLA